MTNALGPWEFLLWMFVFFGGVLFFATVMTKIMNWLSGLSISSYYTDRKCRHTCKGRK